LLELVIDVLEKARREVLDQIGRKRELAFKPVDRGVGGDLTLYVDRVVEDMVYRELKRNLGEFYLLSEERGFIVAGSNPRLYFVLDPLDGTTNILRGIPFASISLAVANSPHSEDLLVGSVIDIARGELYYALSDEGSFKDGTRIRVSNIANLANSIVSLVLNERKCQGLLKRSSGILKEVGHMRFLGSIALELCYLAEGLIDGVACLQACIRNTDLAASTLIVRLAGGVVINPENGESLSFRLDRVERKSFIASNPQLATVMLEILKRSLERKL